MLNFYKNFFDFFNVVFKIDSLGKLFLHFYSGFSNFAVKYSGIYFFCRFFFCLVVNCKFLYCFVNLVRLIICSYFFGWTAHYDIIGYNYTIKWSSKRGLLKVHLGYSRHKIVLLLPKGVKIFCQKRRLHVFGFNFYFMHTFILFFRELRNLFPYKYKGLVFFDSEKKLLKIGKKTKYR